MEDVPLQLSPSCRILTISSSLQRAVSFVHQIQSLSQGSSGSSDVIQSGTSLGKEEASSQEQSIPWTISNKYYSADVHFFAREIKGLAPYLLKGIPALIFVWRKGEAYRHHVHRLSQDLAGVEPEVALAVRLESSEADSSQDIEDAEDEKEFEETNDIDEFLSSRGFEFVDVPLNSSNDDEIFDGIPSLPRVLDALSTIMWPSMQAAIRKKRNINTSKGVQDEDGLLDWAHSSFDAPDHFPSEEDFVVPANHLSGLAAQARKQKEMDELARWLQEDNAYENKTKNDPWQSRASKVMTASPINEQSFSFTSLAPPTPTQERVVNGFDDDFTVFVSAPPAESHSESSSSSKPDHQWSQEEHSFDSFDSFDDEASFDSGKLAPRHDGVMYHSLGSASDLADIDDNKSVKEDSDDEGLPSQDEVSASAARIFGAASVHSTENGSENEDEYDMAAFDLSHVLSALQGMKAEIAGIEDVDERRKAAAKVALGLVYGLERDSGPRHDGEL